MQVLLGLRTGVLVLRLVGDQLELVARCAAERADRGLAVLDFKNLSADVALVLAHGCTFLFCCIACGWFIWIWLSHVRDTGVFGDISVGGNQIDKGKTVNRGVAGDSGEGAQLVAGDIQEVCDALSRSVNLQACPQLRILRCHADRTVAAAADSVLLACRGNQACAGDSNRIGAHCQCFSEISRYAQSAGDDQRDIRSDGIQIRSRTAQGIDGRNRGRLAEHQRTGCRGAASAVDRDKVRLCEYTVFQIAFDISGGDLDADRSSVRPFTQHIDHRAEVFLAVHLGELAGALNVLALLFSADRGDFRRDLLAGKVTAHAGLGSLTDFDFNRV